jgi:16S rRNA (cytosine1402-N4)-methyltransferase
VAGLAIRPEGVYLDGTFGRGGHSAAILRALGTAGLLIAIDRDPAAIESAQRISDPRLRLHHGSYADLDQVLRDLEISGLDGVLLDLGVSSPQLDDPQRGFSFRANGPLDMRMDTRHGITAAEWLHSVPEDQLRTVLREYGEERFAKQIARALITARSLRPVYTTHELAQIVAAAVPTREPGQDPATRTFQAIRILINQELEALALGLRGSLKVLRRGGRLVVISFHSLEDRMVKRFMREASQPPEIYQGLPVREKDLPVPPLRIVGKALRPSAEEVAVNPRARSATLRVAERIG